MDKFYYKNIFLYSSLQFVGNVEEYFVQHSEKLVAFICMPRQQHRDNFIRLYKKGKLVEDRRIILSKNIFLYYSLWYFYHVFFIFKYFTIHEKFAIITYHPYPLFGMSIQKLFRNFDVVYWKGDYFPPVKLALILVEKISKFYERRVKYVIYLTDLVNKKMNGEVLNTNTHRTVMLGIKPKNIQRKFDKDNFCILFVGVIKEAQGLSFLFDFLKVNRDCSVKIIGMGSEDLYKKYQKIIKNYKIENQVYFPNRFFEDKELEEISKSCQVGIALYDTGELSSTYYTDPGKVKTYASLGLPIIMSNVSAVAPYIEKFHCGLLINRDTKEIGAALLEIKNNYDKYLRGLEKFNKHFSYESYYKRSFNFLEKI